MYGLTITLAAAAGALLLIGLARITAWVLDRREYTAGKAAREEQFALQASIDVCTFAADREQIARAQSDLAASGWTDADEQAYQALRADSLFMRSTLREVTRG